MKKNSKKVYTVAIFDIDSASVAATLLEYAPGVEIPQREIASKRVIIESTEIKHFYREVLIAIEKLGTAFLQETSEIIDDVYIIVGAPWAVSQKNIIRYERTHEFVLTPELVQSVQEKDTERQLSKNLDFHRFDGLRVFEQKSLDIFVHGYPSLHPYRIAHKIKDFEVHSLLSVISENSYQSFTEKIERTFSLKPTFVSNTLVSFLSVKKYLPHLQNTVFLDIGGTNTQVYVIVNDRLTEIAVFPIGMTDILKKLSEILSIGKHEARSLLKLYTQSSFNFEYQQKISHAMNEVFSFWYAELFKTAQQLSEKKLLPDTWCIVAPNDIESWVSFHLLKQDSIKSYLKLRSPLSLIHMPQVLKGISREKKLGVLSDSEMIAIADVVGSLIVENK